MIDFAALVLGPAMAVFGGAITLTPVVSQPGAAAYPARGVFSFKPVQIALEDGTYHSTNQPALGIKLGDYAVEPMQEDTLVIPPGAIGAGNYKIVDVVPDGQGGADLMLRTLLPSP